MVRIAVSLAAYQAIAATLAQGREARPPEPLQAGEGVGIWLDRATVAMLRMAREAGEGYSETIMRLCSATAGKP
jgi:hypothetical protein